MHDIVHDFASQVSKNYCYRVKDWKAITHTIEAVHVRIKSCETEMWKNFIPFLPSKLRTLILEGDCFPLPEELFKKCTCFSVLIINSSDWYRRIYGLVGILGRLWLGWSTRKLGNSIGKLKYLRSLDMRNSLIISLPKSFTKLYYLQTLRASELIKVPEGFQNLTNLRHLHAVEFHASLTTFQMRNLQTCKLDEYELNLYPLPDVKSYEHAIKANMSRSLGVSNLKLHWSGGRRRRTKEEGNYNIDVAMEDLKPHPNLTGLRIESCPIRKFPSWMIGGNSFSSSIRNLVSLQLVDLVDCESLPVLGDCPLLERLEIRRLRKVKRIREKFNATEIVCAFPALKQFKLRDMENLEEWSVGIDPAAAVATQSSSSSSSSASVQVGLFPCLWRMELGNNPKLSVLPNLGSLPELIYLTIDGCPNISSDVMKMWVGRGSMEEEIGGKEDDDDERQRHSSTSESDVVVSQEDSYIVPHYQPSPLYFPSLKTLCIRNCGEVCASFAASSLVQHRLNILRSEATRVHGPKICNT